MSAEKDRALKSIFKGGMIVFAGIVFSKFAGLAYRVLVGRYLGPADYGVISVMMAVFSVASTIAFLGVPQGVQRFVSYHRGEEDEAAILGTVWTGLSIVTVSSLVVAVSLYLAAPWLSRNFFHEPNAILPLRMVAVVMPFRAYTAVFYAVTDAYERMEFKIATERVFINATKIALAAGLVWVGYGYLGAAFAYTFAFGLGTFLAVYFAYRLLPLGKGLERKTEYGEIFHYSWPLVMAGLAGIVTGHIDTFMIQFFAGSVAVGLYNGAYPFARLLNTGNVMFSSIFLSNASKMVSAGDTEQLASLFRTVVKWVAIVTLPVFVILIAFPRSVLLFFGEKYYSMAPVLRILAAGFLISSLTGPVSRIYEAFERTKLSMIFSGVLAFSNLLLNYILISTFPSRAPLAAAVATSTAFFVNFVLDVVFMKKMLGRQPFRSSVIRVVGAALTAILVVYLLSNLLFAATPVWFLVIDLLIFSAVYATIVGFGGVLEEDDRVVVEAVLRKLGLSEEHASLLRYA